ncbi:MAG: hypothetical protein ACLRWQ_06960 [Flavonifractor plautii]
MQVKIVELSEDRCRHLSEDCLTATIICGDGTDQELSGVGESDRL